METAYSNNVIEINIREGMLLLLKKLWILLLCGIIGAGAAGVVSKYLIRPVYTSTARMYIINRQENSSLTLADLQSGAQLTKDYMILVKSRPVMDQVIKELKLPVTSDELDQRIKVETPEGTRILEITVTDRDPATAKKIADMIALVSVERMSVVMGSEKANILEEGNLAKYPSSPNVFRYTVLGGLAAAILAGFVIILLHIANDSIRTTEDIEKYLGITVLGMLPIEERLLKDSRKSTSKIRAGKKKRKALLA